MKWVPSLIILLLILAAGAYFLFAPTSASAAILYIESGNVEVNTGKGWIPGIDEMELKQGAQIKTTDGQATVVLKEGEVVHMQPNSEIKLDEIGSNIKITQVAGETWNKVTKLSGVSEFTVETPTTVATVRGTEFIVNDESLAVQDGIVDYSGKTDSKKVKVGAHKKAMAKQMEEEDMTDADIAKFKQFTDKYVKALKRVRMKEIKKQKMLIKMGGKDAATDQQIEDAMSQVDEGNQSVDEVYNKVPGVMKLRLKRIYDITKEIRKIKLAK